MAEKASKNMIVRRQVSPRLSGNLPQADDIQAGRDQILFGKGQWLPSLDPLVIGKENFADLQNLRYGNDGLDTIKGHAKVNTTALTAYPKIRALHQLSAPYTTKSRILAQGFNAGLTEAEILENLSVVPAAADFAAASLGATAAAQGRFARWPTGHVAFCDGQNVKVWAGDEMPVSFISMATHIDYHDEYTQYLRTNDTSDDESIPLMADGWNQTQGDKLYGSYHDLKTNGETNQAFAGRFKANRTGSIHGVSFKLKKNGNPAGNLLAKIYSATGTYPDDYPEVASGIPYLGAESGDDIITESGSTITTENTATSTPVPCASLTTEFSFIQFDFTSPVELTAETYYWIVITADADYVCSTGVTEVHCYYEYYTNSSGLTPIKSMDYQAADGSWNHKPALDLCLTFQIQYKVYIYLGCTRPAQGFNFYINSEYCNVRAASLTLQYGRYSADEIAWTPVSDLSDGTTSSGKSQAQTGACAFTLPTAQKPIFINGLSLYWYRASFSAWLHRSEITDDGYDSPYIYQITVDCPWQNVRSLWSGDSMILTGFKIFDGAKNQDYTSYLNDDAQTTGTEDQLNAFATTKKIYIQTASPAQGFMFRFIPGSYNSNVSAMRIRRYQGIWVDVSDFTDKTAISGASFGQSGMVAFDVSEQDKTLSLDGETAFYTYEISFSATFSSTVELYHVTAIEAPKSIDGYVFPFMFRNRPLLCGYTKGEEGNRVDFGMTDTVDVFTGSDASLGMNNAPLYFGGNDPLTCAIEMYNRLGSTMYHVAVFCKAQETYLLSGYDAETYQIYRLSGGIGCPAPLTIDTVEIGYGSEQAELRCIALWLSYVGPVVCDTATVTPLPGMECYFDRNDSRCINWSAVEKACAVVDLEHLEYHLCFPSGSGQTVNNVWLVFDLMKRRWYRRVANDNQYPQAFCRVVSTNGTPYIFASYDDGHLRRVNTGDTWDTGGTPIACIVDTADVLPTGEMWDVTRLRYLKLLANVASDMSVTLTHYKNGASSGTSLSAAALSATNRHSRHTQPISQAAFSHKLRLAFAAPAGGATLLGMAWKFTVEREDLTSGAGG